MYINACVLFVGQNLSSTLVLEEEGAPEELSVRYRSNCIGSQEVTEWKERGECQGIKHENVRSTISGINTNENRLIK